MDENPIRLESSNSWHAPTFDGSFLLEIRTMRYFVLFLLLHSALLLLKQRGLLGHVLASRPTIVANNIHCITVGVLAVYLLWNNFNNPEKTVEDYALWQQVGIPVTIAYFLGDFVWYCIPQHYSPLSLSHKWDYFMVCHHMVMIICHYPAGSVAGAAYCSIGQGALWSIEMSCLGYLCELCNPLMNYRWWLLQTLWKHRVDFTIVQLLLAATFVARVLLLSGLVCFYVVPVFPSVTGKIDAFLFISCIAGHLIILLLSCYWLKALTKGGLSNMFYFTPPKNKSKGAFTFGSDMGRTLSDENSKKE